MGVLQKNIQGGGKTNYLREVAKDVIEGQGKSTGNKNHGGELAKFSITPSPRILNGITLRNEIVEIS